MKAIGIGRIATDIKTNKTTNGKTVINFTLACDRKGKKKLEQEGKPSADFISCVAWEKAAELIAQYCQKGSQIYVCGDLTSRSYDDANGRKVYVTEVLIEEFNFTSNGNERSTPSQTTELHFEADDLPF